MQTGPQEFSATGEDFGQRVRSLAYALWQQEGEPEGREEEFWLRAEAQLRAQEGVEPPLSSAPDDAHDEAAAQSFPAGDPPAAATTVTALRKHDTPHKETAADEDAQADAGVERRKAGGYA